MSIKLSPDSHLTKAFVSDDAYIGRYAVIASDDVDTYIVDEENLKAFEAGESFEHRGGKASSRMHVCKASIGPGGWYLLIINRGEKTVTLDISETFDPIKKIPNGCLLVIASLMGFLGLLLCIGLQLAERR